MLETNIKSKNNSSKIFFSQLLQSGAKPGVQLFYTATGHGLFKKLKAGRTNFFKNPCCFYNLLHGDTERTSVRRNYSSIEQKQPVT